MLDTQELAPVAIALLLSVIGGIGTFLMDVRDGRQSGQFVGIGYGDLCCSDSWRGGVPIGATRGLGVINYVLNGNDSQQ